MTTPAETLGVARPLVGVVHLPPSLTYAAFPGHEAALAAIRDDVSALERGGADGVLVENDADKPHVLTVSKAIVAWLTVAALEARAATRLPVGIGVQRIDWEATLAIAAAARLSFVRLDVFVDCVRMLGEQVSVEPAEVRALRAALGARDVALWTDVHVKHAELLSGGTLADAARRAVSEGSDAVLVTSERTGEPPSHADLDAACDAVGRARVVVGSGLTARNAAGLAARAGAAVVGTALKGPGAGRIEEGLVRQVVEAWRRA